MSIIGSLLMFYGMGFLSMGVSLVMASIKPDVFYQMRYRDEFKEEDKQDAESEPKRIEDKDAYNRKEWKKNCNRIFGGLSLKAFFIPI